jgi:hypothetical protein
VSHALVDHPLPGLDAARLARLTEGGVTSLEDVVKAGPEHLSNLTGFDLKTCRALVRVAQSAMKAPTDGVIELVPRRSEPPTARLVRGLEAARRIEDITGQVRKARSRAGKKPRKPSHAEAHRRARRQLKKLGATLGEVQRMVLSEGLSAPAREHLADQLEPLETSLTSLLDESPFKKRHLRRLARVSKRARRRLRSSML